MIGGAASGSAARDLTGLAETVRGLHGVRALIEDDCDGWPFTAGGRRFTLAVANSSDLRARAFRLAARMYRPRGYAPSGCDAVVTQPDARRDTLILLVTDDAGADVG